MNRAWIPAGALAGVSVAGLIALGPLTDSLNTRVTFPTKIDAAPQTIPGKAGPSSVPVSITIKGPVGEVNTSVAAVIKGRGGQSTGTAPTAGDAGLVGYQKFHSTSNSTQTATSHTTNAKAAAPPAATTKNAPKRQTSIGTIGEPNSDTGLAGGSKSSTNLGEQSSTPAP
jgi:hypothetical protein